MDKKQKTGKSGSISGDVSFRKLIGRRIRRKVIPVSLGISLIISILSWILLSEYDALDVSSLEMFIVFFVLPAAAVLVVSVITCARMSDMARDKYIEINDAVQRLAMEHYNRPRQHANDEFLPIYDGLTVVAGHLSDRDARIESIGKKCDQLESAHEGETCRWLGAKVDPEMIKNVLSGIETMAKEGRCEDILEVLDDTMEVLAASLEDGIALRPLADELSRIKRFLEIYEVVYQYKVGYRMSIMCNIVNYRIIPNLVLPVVQILFNRAREKQCSDYEIGVEVNSSFTNLLIIVRDNNGLSAEEEFSYEVNDDTASRDAEDGPLTIGAINRRVSSFYGKKYSIKLSSNKLGTAVYIYLPPVSSDNQSSRK